MPRRAGVRAAARAPAGVAGPAGVSPGGAGKPHVCPLSRGGEAEPCAPALAEVGAEAHVPESTGVSARPGNSHPHGSLPRAPPASAASGAGVTPGARCVHLVCFGSCLGLCPSGKGFEAARHGE